MAGYNKPLSRKSAYFLIFTFTCRIFPATSRHFQFWSISLKLPCCLQHKGVRVFEHLLPTVSKLFIRQKQQLTLKKTSVRLQSFVLKDMNWYWLEDMILDQRLPWCVCVCVCACVYTKCVVTWFSPCVPGCGFLLHLSLHWQRPQCSPSSSLDAYSHLTPTDSKPAFSPETPPTPSAPPLA